MPWLALAALCAAVGLPSWAQVYAHACAGAPRPTRARVLLAWLLVVGWVAGVVLATVSAAQG